MREIIYMKVCSRCKQEKLFEEFNRNKTRKDGYQTRCRKCDHEVCREHYLNNKETTFKRVRKNKKKTLSWFKEYKKTLGCEWCPETHIATLDFHHKNPNEKDFEISQMIRLGYTKEKVLKEISKCLVLCANCHRKFHYENTSI